ncbi:MAG: efflux RND transporter periplasmic adaptor subunit, partial [Acidobacteriota bacterium]|nr:efflux RND transporter periplasmic adaptor subunit [Acidobacteriota bacterium]
PGDGRPEVPAKVSVVSPALDPNSTTVQVWVEAANPREQLRPGSTVNIQIVARSVENALVVPAAAVLTGDKGATTVMVIGGDQVAHQTGVQTGIHQDGEVQITSGLRAGQRVVTEGAYGLPDGATVQVSSPAASPAAGDD